MDVEVSFDAPEMFFAICHCRCRCLALLQVAFLEFNLKVPFASRLKARDKICKNACGHSAIDKIGGKLELEPLLSRRLIHMLLIKKVGAN